jgi:hypothetical protein
LEPSHQARPKHEYKDGDDDCWSSVEPVAADRAGERLAAEGRNEPDGGRPDDAPAAAQNRSGEP